MSEEPATAENKVEHLGFLDGMRGIAALYVVLYHAVVSWTGPIPESAIHRRFPLFMFGHYAVTVFIVLSGFCLMLPVARTNDLPLRGGIVGFMKRRSRRILPAYYATLAAAFLVPPIVTILVFNAPSMGQYTWCGFSGRSDLLLHIALLHNLGRHSSQSILPPLWSIATEFQIYIVFALLLLPIMRRFGGLAQMLTAILVAIVPFALFAPRHNCLGAFPWLLIAFSIGMISARVLHTSVKVAIAPAVACIVLLFMPAKFFPSGWPVDMLQQDTIAALIAGALIVFCCHSPANLMRRLLEWRPFVWLGRSSYSLYLTHYLVISGLEATFIGVRPMRMMMRPVLTLLLGVPLSVLFAQLFFHYFERPYLKSKK